MEVIREYTGMDEQQHLSMTIDLPYENTEINQAHCTRRHVFRNVANSPHFSRAGIHFPIVDGERGKKE